MTEAWVPLATVTLGANASGVTFSGISGSYRDLMLVSSCKNTGSGYDNMRLTFNSDSGANYSYVQGYWNGSSIGSQLASTAFIEGMTNASGHSAPSTAEIFDYSATDKSKTVLLRGGAATSDNGNRMAAGSWNGTSAITSVSLVGQSFNFAAGSTFSLWGSSGV